MAAIPDNIIQGVRIACPGDMNFLKVAKYTSVLVPRTDPVFNDYVTLGDPITKGAPVPSASVSKFAELMGIPICIRKIAPDECWKNSDECGVYDNQEAAFLLIEMDPRKSSFLFAPMAWQNEVGSTRVDGKEITTQLVETLCAYNWKVFTERLEIVAETGSLEEQEEVVRSVTLEDFEAFQKGFQKKKQEEDPYWAVIAQPVLMTRSEFENKSGTRWAADLLRRVIH